MRPRVAVIMGGYTSEHNISMKSGAVVMSHIDRDAYEVFPVHINKEVWLAKINGNWKPIDISDFSCDDIKFDVVIALGSINFGSTDKVFAELEKAVSLCTSKAVMFFRVNPGHQHDKPEAKWITFYPWNSNFIMNCADYFNVDVLDLRNDSNNRMYFVWRTK